MSGGNTMVKTKISISLDKDMVDTIKRENPSFNLSGFCNDCLALYLKINSNEFKLEHINDRIKELNLQRELILKHQIDSEYHERNLVEEKNKLWSSLYSQFLYQGECSWDTMKQAITLLGQSENTLIGMMETLKDTDVKIDKSKAYNDWEYVLDLFEDVD